MHSKRLEMQGLSPLALFALSRISRGTSHNFPSIPLTAERSTVIAGVSWR